jgi:hypothetical protein
MSSRRRAQRELRAPDALEAGLALQIKPVGEWQFSRNRKQEYRILGKEQTRFALHGGTHHHRMADCIAGKCLGHASSRLNHGDCGMVSIALCCIKESCVPIAEPEAHLDIRRLVDRRYILNLCDFPSRIGKPLPRNQHEIGGEQHVRKSHPHHGIKENFRPVIRNKIAIREHIACR